MVLLLQKLSRVVGCECVRAFAEGQGQLLGVKGSSQHSFASSQRRGCSSVSARSAIGGEQDAKHLLTDISCPPWASLQGGAVRGAPSTCLFLAVAQLSAGAVLWEPPSSPWLLAFAAAAVTG